MTTQYVTYCTRYKPVCAFEPNASVILCLKDEALVVQFDPPCGLPLTTILATICNAAGFDQGCQNFFYQYTFSYDDEQITDPTTRPLVEGDIESFLCQDCLIDYIQQQVSCVETGGADAWLLAGNAGTVDGTDKLGTTDDVPLTIVVNDLQAFRFQPSSVDGSPDIIGGNAFNAIGGDFSSANFIGNGNDANLIGLKNTIGTIGGNGAQDCFIGSGNNNHIADDAFCSSILGGQDNNIGAAAQAVICGGETNLISGDSEGSLIGAGLNNTITTAIESAIVGGQNNEITGGTGTMVFGVANIVDLVTDLSEGGIVVGGLDNVVTNSLTGADTHGIACFGHNNTITDAFDCSMGGYTNEISFAHYCTIAGGSTSSIFGDGLGGAPNNLALNCFIGAPVFSSIEPSAIGNGSPHYNSIVGGNDNHLLEACQYSSILGGLRNNISWVFYAGILTGRDNLIQSQSFNAEYSVIVSGHNNQNTDADRCNILGGDHHLFSAVSNSAILGGSYLKLGNYSVGFNKGDQGVTTTDSSAFDAIGLWSDIDTWIANTDGTARKLKLFEPNTDFDFSSTNYTSHEAQAQAANIEYVWPAAAGVAGNSLKIQSVVGVVVTLEWA